MLLPFLLRQSAILDEAIGQPSCCAYSGEDDNQDEWKLFMNV